MAYVLVVGGIIYRSGYFLSLNAEAKTAVRIFLDFFRGKNLRVALSTAV